jgi:hypothetical protein
MGSFPAGEWVDLRTGNPEQDDLARAGDWRQDRIVRAEVIAALLLGAAKAEPGRFPAVRLRGARVTGRLDVMGATLTCALVCEFCDLDAAPRFVEATTKTVRFVASRLPGFNGARMRAEGIVNFHRSMVGSVLRLDRAAVAGEVSLREATVGDDGSPEAFAGEGLTVDGHIDCQGLVARGPVWLRGARVSGSVYAANAQISGPQSQALNIETAVIGGGVDGSQLRVVGETRLSNTRVTGGIQMPGAALVSSTGTALAARRLVVDGGIWCDQGFTATGEIRLAGAQLGGSLTLTGARLGNVSGPALNLDRAILADLDAAGLEVSAGSVSLVSTQVASRVNLAGAHLNSEGNSPALDADGSAIGGELILTAARARGEVRARTSRIGGRIRLREAEIANPGAMALRLSRAEVAADVFCRDMTVVGRVNLGGARIGRLLDLKNVRLLNPGGVAVDARALQATEVSLQSAEPIQGAVILSHARLGVLRDDPTHWPAELAVDGLTYDTLEPPVPARQRLRWLAAVTGGHLAQPYEQLAALYTRAGQPAEARQVLYAAERCERARKTVPGRVWSLIQDITVGYGYKPLRAALWLGALLVIGSVTYAANSPPPLSASAAPHFNPVVYTMDLLLPVVDLGQKHSFNPAGFEQWFSYLLVAAGWVLATTIATAAARIITRR